MRKRRTFTSEFIADVAGVFEKGNKGNETQARMAELERLVGKLALENEILKKPPVS